VAGYLLLHEKMGKLDRRRLLRPAIQLAEKGFLVDRGLHESLKEAAPRLRRFPETAAIFLPGGAPPAVGNVLAQPELARTLRAIAESGALGFYSGRVADDIARGSREYGGILRRSDLEAYQAKTREPLRRRWRGHDVLTVPPPSSGGIALLQMLSMFEVVDYAAMRPEQRIHFFAEVARRAFADRAGYLGDPDFSEVPVARLLDPEYLRARMTSIEMTRAHSSGEVAAGLGPAPESEATCHFSVVDRDGRAVSCTTTLNGAYGCGLAAAGVLLNNEMDDFTTKPGAPNSYGLVQSGRNSIAPGKRPISSMTPTILLRDGKPWLVLGSPGGPTIISTVCQVILNVEALGMDLPSAVAAPRVHHQWLPDEIVYERIGARERHLLEGLGHKLAKRARPIGDVQAIAIEGDGTVTGASDPRGRGREAW
ncbi:MAG: gamma-glutamyltransferase, partial [Planctomycetota bacterium]